MAYAIRHITDFCYRPAVRESVMELRVQPRSDARQRCLSFSLDVTPQANIMLYRDFLANTVHHFDIPGNAAQIQIITQSLVEVLPAPAPDPRDAGEWHELDARIAASDFWEMLLPSQFVKASEELEKLAAELHVSRRGNALVLLLEINNAVYEAFDYVPNSTAVDSPIDDALRSRQGVCQDFAHVMIALVRKLGIPCRYVSGYLFHEPKTHDRSAVGATHAWVEAFLPELGWIGLDPTNNLVCGERHIRVAIGRDYADVPPTRGVYKGEAESELSVSVTVQPVESPEPEELPPATVIRSRPRNGDGDRELAFQQQQQQ